MERFPRGSIPPSTFAAIATLAPTAVTKAPATVASPAPANAAAAATAARPTDEKATDARRTDEKATDERVTDDRATAARPADAKATEAVAMAVPGAHASDSVPGPTKQCDLSTTCPNCGTQMQPEHAHYRCGACGYRDSCCF